MKLPYAEDWCSVVETEVIIGTLAEEQRLLVTEWEVQWYTGHVGVISEHLHGTPKLETHDLPLEMQLSHKTLSLFCS